MAPHPSNVLTGSAPVVGSIPVCDHYCGVHARMVKSLSLQRDFSQEFGTCVFDVTLDCEDGAPVGGERDHAQMIAELVQEAVNVPSSNHPAARVAVRVHPVDHPTFEQDVAIILGRVGHLLCHVMLPKIESLSQLERALTVIDSLLARQGHGSLPVHVLVESALAVQNVAVLAAHPRVASISFGLMDFVSSHGGAIPASAMSYSSLHTETGLDQFSHPLVVRAKLEIAAACHAAGKVPSHCVVTEYKDSAAMQRAVRCAAQAFGFTRMWSIHPDQIRPILAAMSPAQEEVQAASQIVCAAHAADWAPISVAGRLHDRASYRYYWEVLQRAQQTGKLLSDDPARIFFTHSD